MLLAWLALLVCVAETAVTGKSSNGFLAETWAALGQNQARDQPRCVSIPSNFSLCHGIQYNTMRLPNLLEHETMSEAIQQSDAWNSLLRLHCHPETRGCEPRMKQYGFPWPEMLACDHFPADNDMCIKSMETDAANSKHSRTLLPEESNPGVARSNMSLSSSTTTTTPTTTTSTSAVTTTTSESKRACQSCVQAPTLENLVDNFCRTNVVMKAKLIPFNATHLKIQRVQRVFKPQKKNQKHAKVDEKRVHPGVLLRMADLGRDRSDCNCPAQKKSGGKSSGAYLVMSDESNLHLDVMSARLILPWHHDKVFKSAIRRFHKVDCSALGREIREGALKAVGQR